jgi:small-conductance mechanosensitive channel
MKRYIYLSTFLLIALCATLGSAQNVPAPVVFKGDTLFIIENKIGGFSPQQRAEMIQRNIRQLAKLPLAEFDSLRITTSGADADILHRRKVIATITQVDATTANEPLEQLAETKKRIIRKALIDDFNDTSIGNLGKDIGLFFLALIGFLIVLWIVNSTFDYFRRNLKTLSHNVFFQNNRFVKFFELITPETERGILLFLLRMTRFTAIGVFLYFYLPFMFSQISYTRGFGEKLMGYVLRPLRFLADSFVGFLPNLLFIFIIIIAVKYLIKGLGYFAIQIKTERIKVNGFFPDWAFPTFNLFRVLIIIFTLVIIFPYLPGSGSDAFQGVSVFIGLLLSLGSAGIISNVISGVILTYMRPFKIGDFVKINNISGSVISRNLLVTRVKTTKNEETTIPNAILLGGGVVNYSTLAEEQGLILPTTITIGYDVPWTQVHQLLEDAALRTDLVEKEPKPFVLQKSLDDWYVAYELNVYTKDSHKISKIYSNLHANIQDVFNEAGLEIMSSHYMAVRDGNQMAVPQNYLKKDYKAPAFKVDNSTNKPTNEA